MTVIPMKLAGWPCDIARQCEYLNSTSISERLFYAVSGSDGQNPQMGDQLTVI